MSNHAYGDNAGCSATNAVKMMARPEQALTPLLGMLNDLPDAVPPPDLCQRTIERVEQDVLARRRSAPLISKAS